MAAPSRSGNAASGAAASPKTSTPRRSPRRRTWSPPGRAAEPPSPPTTPSTPRPRAPPSSPCRTAWFTVLLFGPVVCGVMFEDMLHFVRSWWDGATNSIHNASWNGTSTPSPVDSGDAADPTLVAKVTAMAVLGLASLTLGLVPLKLAVWLGWDRHAKSSANGPADAIHGHGSPAGGGAMLSSLLCFGGGVLMCTTFLHMLPEVQEAFGELEEHGAIPEALAHTAPYLLMCMGFFIMYLVEELVHMYLHWRSHGKLGHSHGDHGHGHSHGASSNHNNVSLTYDVEDAKKSPIKALKWRTRDCKPSTVVLEYADGSEVKSEVPSEYLVSSVTFATPWGLHSTPGAPKQYLRVDAERPCCRGVPRLHSTTASSGHKAEAEHSHVVAVEGEAAAEEDAVVTALRGLLIVLALSVHELFEGLAIGLEGEAGNVWYMLVAVACHKLVIAFCIGVELVAMRTKGALHVLYVSTFAVVSPLGIGVGILVTESYSDVEGGVVPTLLQGLATGTLLYVVFFEILERQRAGGHSGLRQYVAVLVGFLVMFGMMFIGGHEHHHDHHDHDEVSEHLLKASNYTVLHTQK